MKILQIMPEFGLAGAEIMCENLVYELTKLHQEVIVVSLYNYHSAITDRLERNGIRVIYLDKKPGLDFSMVIKLIELIKKENPDVVHTHRYVMQYVIPATIFTGVRKKIHTVHNVAEKENTAIARRLNSIFYKYFDVIPVALSSEIRRTIEKEYRLSQERIPVVLNGIDVSKCKKKINYEIVDTLKVIHVGRFSHQKNHKCLIEAYYKFSNNYAHASKLILIGDGELREEIKSMVEKMGMNELVEFRGLKDDVFDDLNESDIFVLPSQYEGVPMTLIEAMGTGMPIIATRVGGIPDMLIDKKEAFLIENDPNCLYEALMKLAEDVNLRKSFGERVKTKSTLFSSKRMAELYLKIYSGE